MLPGHLVAKDHHGGKQAQGRAVVGVTARVGLCGQVLCHGYLMGQFCLFVGDFSQFLQVSKVLFRRWGKEFAGDLFAGHLGDDPIGTDDLSLIVSVNAVDAVFNQGHRQIQICGCRNQPDLLGQVEVNGFLFQSHIVGAVDQVEAVGY